MVSLKPEEISKLIKEQIRRYDDELEVGETGTVITIGDGISLVHGLNNAMSGELLLFPHDVYGMVLNLEEEHVGAVLLGDDEGIKEGDEVKRTGKIVEVPVGDMMLGRVLNALGQAIDGGAPIVSEKYRPVERVAPGVMTRKSVHQPIQTGLKIIDSMIPIGKGQRELIIGDRQTGKTAIAIDTIINQKGKNVKCIYVAIGQKASTVAQIVEKLRKHGAMEYTTIVSSTASEPAPLQYIAPYAGFLAPVLVHMVANLGVYSITYDNRLAGLSRNTCIMATIVSVLITGVCFWYLNWKMSQSAGMMHNEGK